MFGELFLEKKKQAIKISAIIVALILSFSLGYSYAQQTAQTIIRADYIKVPTLILSPTTRPTTPSEGQMYFDISDKTPYIYGGEWKSMIGAGAVTIEGEYSTWNCVRVTAFTQRFGGYGMAIFNDGSIIFTIYDSVADKDKVFKIDSDGFVHELTDTEGEYIVCQESPLLFHPYSALRKYIALIRTTGTQSVFTIMKNGEKFFERDASLDASQITKIYGVGISPSGKYIVLLAENGTASPYPSYYSLYAGDESFQQVIIASCDSKEPWTVMGYEETPVSFDTTTKTQGTSSINVGKQGTSDIYFGYTFEKSITFERNPIYWANAPPEGYNVKLLVDIYVSDQDTLNKLNLTDSYIILGDFEGIQEGFIIGSLTTGWNTKEFTISTVNPREVGLVAFYFATKSATDTIPSGNIKVDNIRLVKAS